MEINLDKILSKYVSVWIWSILFGANSYIISSFINYRKYFNNDSLQFEAFVILLFMLIVGSIFAIVAYWQLFTYLSRYLIPRFFTQEIKEDDINYHTLASAKLKKVLIAIILTFLCRILLVILDLTFDYLSANGITFFQFMN
jgi:uncharacterized membrane protein